MRAVLNGVARENTARVISSDRQIQLASNQLTRVGLGGCERSEPHLRSVRASRQTRTAGDVSGKVSLSAARARVIEQC